MAPEIICGINRHTHASADWGVALSADGRLLATGSNHGTVRLWDANDGRGVAAMHGHTGAVAVSADAQLLASGSGDGTVKLWDPNGGTCIATLRNDPCYERLDITGLTGVTAAQRFALLALGAVEQPGPAGERDGAMLSSRARSLPARL